MLCVFFAVPILYCFLQQQQPPPAENTDANDAAPQKAVIWGTDIDVNDVSRHFLFIFTFFLKKKNWRFLIQLSARFVEFLQMWPDEDTGLPLYGALLEQMVTIWKRSSYNTHN